MNNIFGIKGAQMPELNCFEGFFERPTLDESGR